MAEESPVKKVDDFNKEVPDLRVAGYTFFNEQSSPLQPEAATTPPVSVDAAPVNNQSLAVPEEVVTPMPVAPNPPTQSKADADEWQPDSQSVQTSASQFGNVRENHYAAASERNHDVTQFDPMTVNEVKSRPRVTLVFFAVVIAISLFIVLLSSSRSTTNPSATRSAGNAASTDGDGTFGPYMSNLQRSIKRGWFPPKGHESKRIVVQFKVYKDGSVDNLRIVTTSGVQLADEAALNAVRHATFQPLPAGAPASVDIQFTFDYNVFARK